LLPRPSAPLAEDARIAGHGMSLRAPLALWTSFVLIFAALSYSVRFSEGKPDADTLYKWSTAAGGLAQFAIVGLIVFGIAGLGRRSELLALRRPTSWRLAVVIGIGIGIAMLVLLSALAPLLRPGQEQGLTPDRWEPSHAAAYVANGLVVCVVAPLVEELTFRGLGYSLLIRFGRWTAIVLVGVLFALAHGLVEAFPFLAAFGAMLAYLRSRVDSVYPGMVVHALFNATALVVAVAG
jgi:membrane protease YdiL (CAAX protease family)